MPLVNMRGVYVLPGIPRLFTAMVEAHKEPFRGPACSSAVLYTNTVEGDLAGAASVSLGDQHSEGLQRLMWSMYCEAYWAAVLLQGMPYTCMHDGTHKCLAHMVPKRLRSVLVCIWAVLTLLSDPRCACMRCADPLRRIAGEHPGVSIGSYPNVSECSAVQSFRVRLQLESRDEEALQKAVAAVKEGVECISAPAK